jgi:hypothetical protein
MVMIVPKTLEQGAIMDKIDLIIDALNGCKGLTQLDNVCIAEALAAARELKALQPVAWWNPRYETDFAIALKEYQGWNVPLYALDEVTK